MGHLYTVLYEQNLLYFHRLIWKHVLLYGRVSTVYKYKRNIIKEITYINVYPSDIKNLVGLFFGRRVSVELVPTAVPLDRVKGRPLEIIMAA